MSFQTHYEAILKPCRSHITIVGTNMASIWLRYGFDMAFKRIIWELSTNYQGVFKEYSGNLGTIFLELLNRFWIPVSFPFVNIQQKQTFYTNVYHFFSNFKEEELISNTGYSCNVDKVKSDLEYQVKLLKK